ncbi:MAG: hypothetical protein QOH06_3092 [Acidobacteriota bacterium]|jgi:hypothetical protein|nr:hypothetical protein [Acidobacteriota bacterium]
MVRRLRRLVAIGVVLIAGAGCRTISDGGGHPLPTPPPESTNYSDYEPTHPYEPSGEGVAERSEFLSSSLQGYSVEVRDFLVSPTQSEADLGIGGAALLEVRQGSGKASVGKRAIKLYPGKIFTLNEGERLIIRAYREPLALRTWIISTGEAP